jgi:hypothetical protein
MTISIGIPGGVEVPRSASRLGNPFTLERFRDLVGEPVREIGGGTLAFNWPSHRPGERETGARSLTRSHPMIRDHRLMLDATMCDQLHREKWLSDELSVRKRVAVDGEPRRQEPKQSQTRRFPGTGQDRIGGSLR